MIVPLSAGAGRGGEGGEAGRGGWKLPERAALTRLFLALDAYARCPWLHGYGHPDRVPRLELDQAIAYCRCRDAMAERDRLDLMKAGGLGMLGGRG